MIEKQQYFPGKKEGDKVVFIAKKHWIRYVFVLAFFVFSFTVPLIVMMMLVSQVEQSSLATQISTLSIGIYLLVVVALVFHVFVDFYLDMLAVTEDKLIYIRQNGFFDRQIDEIHLNDLEEIGVDVRGILKDMFDYGDLIIHSANEDAVLTVDSIPCPSKVAAQIMDLHKQHVDNKKKEESKPDDDVYEIKES